MFQSILAIGLFTKILLIVLAVVILVAVVLFFLGRNMQKKQTAQKEQMDAVAETMSILVIDKKRMKLSEAGLPKMVLDQTPKYLRRTKLPIVKAKIGMKVMSLIADEKVFASLPIKKEAKVVISGIYITEIKSVRGGVLAPPPKKKRFGRKKA